MAESSTPSVELHHSILSQPAWAEAYRQWWVSSGLTGNVEAILSGKRRPLSGNWSAFMRSDAAQALAQGMRSDAAQALAQGIGTVWMNGQSLGASPEPSNFNSLVGQDVLRQRLRIQIEDARRRSALLPHILLCGPPSRGKATFAAAIANELQRPYHVVDARSVRQIGALSALLTKGQEYDIFGILDIDAVPRLIMESLVSAIENYQMKITIGKGPSEREIMLAALPRFTLIGTTSKPSRVDERLARWMTVYDLMPYSDREMQELVTLLATRAKLTLPPEAAQLLAQHSEGSPGSASVLLRKLLYHEYHVQGEVSLDTATAALRGLGYQQSPTNSHAMLQRLRAMSGTAFERFVAEVFQRQGYTAEVTGTSGDHGIDIMLRRHGHVVAVQCKQWDNAVGEPVVRDFYGAMINAGVDTGYVVTTSTFTAQAERFAQNKPIKLYDIDALIQLFLDTLSHPVSATTT